MCVWLCVRPYSQVSEHTFFHPKLKSSYRFATHVITFYSYLCEVQKSVLRSYNCVSWFKFWQRCRPERWWVVLRLLYLYLLSNILKHATVVSLVNLLFPPTLNWLFTTNWSSSDDRTYFGFWFTFCSTVDDRFKGLLANNWKSCGCRILGRKSR